MRSCICLSTLAMKPRSVGMREERASGYLVVALAVEIVERAVLQLPLYLLHTEPVGDGGVDLHRLGGLYELLGAALVVHGAHIVQPVGNFDEDDADVLGHGHEHLAQVLGLLLLVAGPLDAGQLGDALDYVRDGGAELALDLVVGDGRVLYDVVQQRGDHAVLVEALLGDYLRRGEAVRHVGRAVAPLLLRVSRGGVFIGGAHADHVHRHAARAEAGLEPAPALLRVEGGVSPAFGPPTGMGAQSMSSPYFLASATSRRTRPRRSRTRVAAPRLGLLRRAILLPAAAAFALSLMLRLPRVLLGGLAPSPWRRSSRSPSRSRSRP